MKEWKIGREDAGQPLKKFCMKYLRNAPASFTYRMLRKKNILLNAKKADGSEVLREGDNVTFYLADDTLSKFTGSGGRESIQDNTDTGTQSFKTREKGAGGKVYRLKDEQILYREEDYLILNKPAGLLSQKAEENDYSANEAVRDYLGIHEDSLFRPSAVNRLDRNTSGILLFGLTVKGAAVLSEILRERSVEKYYLAIVKGNCRLQGEYVSYLQKDSANNKVSLSANGPGEEIRNRFTPLKVVKAENLTVIRVELLTGKTHQIRAQLSFLGHPIIGDRKYGGSSPLARRQLLHAFQLHFPDDDRLGKLSGKRIEAPLPGDMKRFLPEDLL